MKTGAATGLQITFFLLAVVLLAVPLTTFVARAFSVDEAHRDLLGRMVAFTTGGLLLLLVAPLRRAAAAFLAAPIPASRRLEVALASLAKVALMLAVSGAIALGIWIAEGEAALAARMRPDPMAELAFAFSAKGLVFHFLMGALVSPVLEELVFRGFLYRAWERRWGWVPATLGVSTLFALYHLNFANAFCSSVLFVCLFRRTGSLWAPIIAHSVGNMALWYPFAGRFLRPPPEAAIGDISSWGLQLACLLFAAIALPLYAWMSREKPFPPTVFLER